MEANTINQRSREAAQAEVRSLRTAMTLEAAADNAWRVCDDRLATGEGRFIAFVEFRRDRFEVMQIANDFEWVAFPTMDEALDHVASTNSYFIAYG